MKKFGKARPEDDQTGRRDWVLKLLKAPHPLLFPASSVVWSPLKPI